MITAANLMIIRDSRFRLVDGYNLEISNVMPQDAGDYVCQLSDENNKDLIHTVEILGNSHSFPSSVYFDLKRKNIAAMPLWFWL